MTALTRARDGSKWTRVTPRKEPQQYTKPARVDLVVLLCLALVAKTMSLPSRFRGYPPTHYGQRARARAAGYANHRTMVAEQNLARLNARAATPANSTEYGPSVAA